MVASRHDSVYYSVPSQAELTIEHTDTYVQLPTPRPTYPL